METIDQMIKKIQEIFKKHLGYLDKIWSPTLNRHNWWPKTFNHPIWQPNGWQPKISDQNFWALPKKFGQQLKKFNQQQKI
jgi:hypothetical protein